MGVEINHGFYEFSNRKWDSTPQRKATSPEDAEGTAGGRAGSDGRFHHLR